MIEELLLNRDDKMDKKLKGALQMILAIAIAAAVLYLSGDIAALEAHGYFGAFLIAALSSATIIFPAPGWAAVIAMSAYLDPLMLGIAAGLGAAIGELTGYMAGEGARDILNNRVKETKAMEDMVKKHGMPAILLLALIPNPVFDIAGVIAGGMKMPWWKFLIACAIGRVLRYVGLAMLGAFTFSLIV